MFFNLFVLLISLSFLTEEAWSRVYTTPLQINRPCIAEVLRLTSRYKCDSEGNIICLKGWSHPERWCNVPICDVHGETCKFGTCILPKTCACQVGWFGELCDKCIPLSGCLNGICKKPFECHCFDGWSGYHCDKPACNNCVHGKCKEPNKCICDPGWQGENCDECVPIEDCVNCNEDKCSCKDGFNGDKCDQCLPNPQCVNGDCIDTPGECICRTGWDGENCDSPKCNDCPENSICSFPDTCTCNDGWFGENCDQCLANPQCVNGDCIDTPGECICQRGWDGENCDSPQCNDCPENSFCLSPDTCTCNDGWFGENCDQCLPNPQCVNGDCTDIPGQCNCRTGWDGENCDSPKCNDCPDNSFCSSPGVCTCNIGWTGENCEQCVKDPKCIHGLCINRPGQCICHKGWSGKYCDFCIDKKLCHTSSVIKKEWSDWSHWSVCRSKNCYVPGIQWRHRDCVFSKDWIFFKQEHNHAEDKHPKLHYCFGESIEKKHCKPEHCHKNLEHKIKYLWTDWSDCTAKCIGDKGTRYRIRLCYPKGCKPKVENDKCTGNISKHSFKGKFPCYTH